MLRAIHTQCHVQTPSLCRSYGTVRTYRRGTPPAINPVEERLRFLAKATFPRVTTTARRHDSPFIQPPLTARESRSPKRFPTPRLTSQSPGFLNLGFELGFASSNPYQVSSQKRCKIKLNPCGCVLLLPARAHGERSASRSGTNVSETYQQVEARDGHDQRSPVMRTRYCTH